jgi:hypothetical protein
MWGRPGNLIPVTWHLTEKDHYNMRCFVSCRYFEAYPSHQRHFKAFKDVPLKDLPSNRKFQAHCTSVVYALTSVVDNLEDAGCLVEMLSKLGQNHHRHGISRQEFIVSSNWQPAGLLQKPYINLEISLYTSVNGPFQYLNISLKNFCHCWTAKTAAIHYLYFRFHTVVLQAVWEQQETK